MKERINEATQAQQVIERADELRILWGAGRSLDVRPIGRDQRLTSVRQNENELQAAAHARVPEHLQRLPLERVMQTRDGYPFRKVLMVGSVWRFPSTTSITTF